MAAGNTPASLGPCGAGALGAQWRGGGQARLEAGGGERRGGGKGMGSRGQPEARDTRWRETVPAVSQGRGGVPPAPPRGSKLGAGPRGRPDLCPQASPRRQVLRGQPGEALPPGLPATDHPGPHPLPLPSLPQHHSREQSPRGLLATARGPLQMFAAGPWLAPDAREDGQEAGRLLFTCSGGAGRACRASGSGRRGRERVRRGKGVCPPTPLPRQALPPKMSLFTARRGDFLLLEKRAFYRGLESRVERAGRCE